VMTPWALCRDVGFQNHICGLGSEYVGFFASYVEREREKSVCVRERERKERGSFLHRM